MKIDELAALGEAATAGPWAWSYVGDQGNGYMIGIGCGSSGESLSGFVDDSIDIVDPVLIGEHEAATCNYTDPALIVAARNHWHALLAVARAARAVYEADDAFTEASPDAAMNKARAKRDADLGRALAELEAIK